MEGTLCWPLRRKVDTIPLSLLFSLSTDTFISNEFLIWAECSHVNSTKLTLM